MIRLKQRVKWTRMGGYECSTKGDSRFSAFNAMLADGRTIEQHYQCDVKGYQPGGLDWRLGKGKPPLDRSKDLWTEYLGLWKSWAVDNEHLMVYLAEQMPQWNYTVSDCFANTPINQARALAEILNQYAPASVGRFGTDRFGLPPHEQTSRIEKLFEEANQQSREFFEVWIDKPKE